MRAYIKHMNFSLDVGKYEILIPCFVFTTDMSWYKMPCSRDTWGPTWHLDNSYPSWVSILARPTAARWCLH